MFAGPVIDCTEVDPSAFTFCVEMCAPSDITGRKAFARGVTKLVKRRVFSSRAETFETLRLLCSTGDNAADAGQVAEPTWSSTHMDDGLSDTACRQLIDRASRVVRDASGVLARGDVTYHRRLPPATHPWVRYVTRQQRRRAVYRGARAARAASSFCGYASGAEVDGAGSVERGYD